MNLDIEVFEGNFEDELYWNSELQLNEDEDWSEIPDYDSYDDPLRMCEIKRTNK
jgi:hypothetical protein